MGPDGSASHVASAAGIPPRAAAALHLGAIAGFWQGAGGGPSAGDADLLLEWGWGRGCCRCRQSVLSTHTPRPPLLPSPTVPPTTPAVCVLGFSLLQVHFEGKEQSSPPGSGALACPATVWVWGVARVSFDNPRTWKANPPHLYQCTEDSFSHYWLCLWESYLTLCASVTSSVKWDNSSYP